MSRGKEGRGDTGGRGGRGGAGREQRATKSREQRRAGARSTKHIIEKKNQVQVLRWAEHTHTENEGPFLLFSKTRRSN